MLISEQYIALQKKLHERGNYGVSSGRYADAVKQIAANLRTYDILDYGCGQRMLEKALGFGIHNYDPCIPEVSASPAPADLVVCSDVLEHIEPDNLDDVLDDLKRVTKKVGFFVVATGPANKVLDDGRNAHLIQEGARWWMPKILERFDLIQFQHEKQNDIFVVKA